MKIAIVHDFLIKLGGAEKVLQSLHRIYPEAPIYTLLYDRNGTKDVFESNGYQIISSSLQNRAYIIRKRSKLLLTSFPRAIEEFDFSAFDLVISSSNSFAHGIITGPKTFHICYCYSPTRYLWDWHHQYLAENSLESGLISIKVRKILSDLRIWDFCAASRVDKWIAISKTVAKRINKYYRVNASVIYPPTPLDQFIYDGKLAQNFFLIVSRLSPYKKIDLAVRAFNQNGLNLIIVGEGNDRKRLESLAKDNIRFLGFQSDKNTIELMQKCRALIFPGEEDFGITPVEAMACGRPVVAFNKGGVTETVIGGQTGIFFDKPTPDSLNEAVDKLLSNYNSILPANCRKRAEKFSEQRFVSNFCEYVSKIHLHQPK